MTDNQILDPVIEEVGVEPEYQTLTDTEKDDHVVNFMKAQETDLYLHNINKQRYETMLQNLPEGKWKERVQTLLDETNERIQEVSSTIEATKPQMPDQTRVDSALARIAEKEKGVVASG